MVDRMLAAMQMQGHHHVNDEAGKSDQHNAAGGYCLRRLQPADRLVNDGGNHNQHQQRIEQCDQHFGTQKAEIMFGVGRHAREPGTEPCQRKRGSVRSHMAGIAEQRQRTGQPAANRLDDGKTGNQQQRPEKNIGSA